MNNIEFIIENGYNTSHMEAIFIAMFYSSHQFYDLLYSSPVNENFYYVQELIKTSFIDPLKKKYTIQSSELNEIRNYMYMCGLNNDDNNNLLDLCDPIKLFEFMIGGLGNLQLCIDICNNTGCVQHKVFDYVKLTEKNIINEGYELATDVEKMINIWISNELLYDNNVTYHFIDIPTMIPLYFDRNSRIEIDIMKKIKFKNAHSQEHIRWSLCSIVCKSKFDGHYYAINKINNEWLIYDSYNLCQTENVSKFNDNIASSIKSEWNILLYKLDGM